MLDVQLDDATLNNIYKLQINRTLLGDAMLVNATECDHREQNHRRVTSAMSAITSESHSENRTLSQLCRVT